MKIFFNYLLKFNLKRTILILNYNKIKCLNLVVNKTHRNYASETNRTKNIIQHNKMAQIIDGKKIAVDIRLELKSEISEWVKLGNRPPKLATILIGSDPASATYVRNKVTAAEEVGILSDHRQLPDTVSQKELIAVIDDLNNDDTVDGILVQLPVPEHIDERTICNAVSFRKDVDGFHEINVGRLTLDMQSIVPCTPLGVQELLRRTGIQTFGRNVVVAGRSKNVGLPMAMLIHSDERHGANGMDGTVTICHRYTPAEELKRFCLSADIIITATGVRNLIKANMVKPGACVIDVGLVRYTDPETGKTRLCGDVDFENVKNIAGYITPVPGGVGPMTVAMLMKNTFTIAKNLAAEKSKNDNL